MATKESNSSKTRDESRRSSCLPSCFGCSLLSDSDSEDKPVSRAGSDRWLARFSWSRFRKRGKTVPVDASVELAVDPNGRVGRDVEHVEITSHERDDKRRITGKFPAAVSDQKRFVQKLWKAKKSRHSNSKIKKQHNNDAAAHVHVSIDSKTTRLPHLSSLKYDARHPPVPLNRMSGPPQTGSGTSRFSSHELKHPTNVGTSGTSGHKPRRRTDKLIGNLYPGVGLLVLAVATAVVVLCGRACAVVCICAWFYLYPRLRSPESVEFSGGRKVSREMDPDSEEYKKRVVLEGLLERNGRKASGFL